MGSPPAGSPIWNITGAAWVDYAPNTRFAIYSPGPSPTPEVVWDKETGLVWERSPSTTQRAWDPAIVYSFTTAIGGRLGWRLPAIEELLSLSDPSQTSPEAAVPPSFPQHQDRLFLLVVHVGFDRAAHIRVGLRLRRRQHQQRVQDRRVLRLAGARSSRTRLPVLGKVRLL